MGTKWIGHTRCPECAAEGKDTRGDNLGVLDDGSVYCFSCGYSKSVFVGKNIRKSAKSSGEKTKLWLPNSSSPISSVALNWLASYGIFTEDIEKYQIFWTKEKKALVFPFYDEQQRLVFYQLRYFDGPKRWKSYGEKPIVYLGTGTRVVLVEDIISAIKVSKITTAIPLFGSTIDVKKLLQIRKQYDNITIWLDYDKAQSKKTKHIIATTKTLFKETNQIVTEKDPKAYSTEEIRDKLN